MTKDLTKPFWQSKELLLVALGVANYLLNWQGLPSVEPTPEVYGALTVLIGFVRSYFTTAGVRWSFK